MTEMLIVQRMIKTLATCILAAAALDTPALAQSPTPLTSPPAATAPSLSDWQADLAFLRREMPRRHRNLYHDTDSVTFERQFEALRRQLPRMSTAQRVAGILRLGAMIHDAHSGTAGIPPAMGFENLPIVVYLYDDGLYIQGADSAHASLVGARIDSIGSLGADSAVRVVGQLTDASNPMTVAAFVKFRVVRPDLLAALGITNTPDRARLVIEQNGTRRAVVLHSLGRAPNGAANPGATGFWPSIRPRAGWVDVRDLDKSPTPWWLQHPDSSLWSSYDPATKTLYAQCNFVLDTDKETLGSFFHRVLIRADQPDVDRLILDLRQNGGGNNMLLRPVIQEFARSKIAQTRGKFFVITGRLTRSAAENFVNRLELYAEPIFVGEPTGERPNMYGDPEPLVLPRTGITMNLASLYWQDMGPLDVRQWTGPYLAAPLTAREYREGRDPAVDLILRWRVDQPFAARMAAALANPNSSEVERQYRAFTRDPLHRWTDVFNDMFALADSLNDQAENAKGGDKARLQRLAIQLLRLNVGDHDDVSRAHSQLAAALSSAGLRIEARTEAAKAVKIDQHNPVARAILE